MFDLMDQLLLRRGLTADDETVTFRRIDGSVRSSVIYFLPWSTPYVLARRAGFLPLEFLACYEMPPAIVSSDPERSIEAMFRLVEDAEGLLRTSGASPASTIVVGLSVGTYPATVLANRLGARLCSVAPSDRADLMIWQSPALRIVKGRAMARGFRLHDFAAAMQGRHPVQNLANVAANSVFVLGRRDPFIPRSRGTALVDMARTSIRQSHIVELDAGHVRTMSLSRSFQRALLQWVGRPGKSAARASEQRETAPAASRELEGSAM